MILAAVALGYLLGSIPFGLVLTRAAGLGDVRRIGSGSIGATNVLRTGRKGLAAGTLLLDAAKGFVAVLLARRLGGMEAGLVAGAAALLGHMFPVWIGFRGGKGVATGLGVLLAASWPVALGAGLCWAAMAAATRISSASALLACAVAPPLAWIVDGRTMALFALALAAMIVGKHHANIRRLLAGTEPRFGQGK